MPFEATKQEWSELYSFFRLLSDGAIFGGTYNLQKKQECEYPIAAINRVEHDGMRCYKIEEDCISITGENIDKIISRSEIKVAADLILEAIYSSISSDVTSPDEVEKLLDEMAIYNLCAMTEDRTDISIIFYRSDAPSVGVSIYSHLGKMKPLLDGGRTANLKFELTGIKFASPTVDKVNGLESNNSVVDRMLLIERLGGKLKYVDVADKVFRCNLQMIDLHFPRMIAEMVKLMQLDNITKISELIERIKEINPLKIKDELIHKHHFYEYKMKQFLSAVAFGMRPAKIFNGTDSLIEGIVLVNGKGELLFYPKSEKKETEDFLFQNTRLEKSSPDKDRYGVLERENGVHYFKLNLKIGLSKR